MPAQAETLFGALLFAHQCFAASHSHKFANTLLTRTNLQASTNFAICDVVLENDL